MFLDLWWKCVSKEIIWNSIFHFVNKKKKNKSHFLNINKTLQREKKQKRGGKVGICSQVQKAKRLSFSVRGTTFKEGKMMSEKSKKSCFFFWRGAPIKMKSGG
jgi:nitrate/TMAO reductase-like tetraheme cytochrome c subunit